VVLQPSQYLLSVLVRREDRIEDVLDHAVANDEGEALVEAYPAGFERGQAQCGGKAKACAG
jgi:hypothetical protein